MAGIDENITIFGDWVPPSPTPRVLFSPILGDDISSRTLPEPFGENRSEGLFLRSKEQVTGGSADKKDVAQTNGDKLTDSCSFSEQKSSSRGGLLERMAARAGFNAPRLNTESIKSADISLNPETRSPCLTIPPGLSPTTLLESPVFLSNSLAQPSPTTGKFPFLSNGSNKCSKLISDSHDKSKDILFEDMDPSFAFKPATESGSSFFFGGMSKITPAKSFPNIEVSVRSENSLRSNGMEPTKSQSQYGKTAHFPADFLKSTTEKDNEGDTITTDQRDVDTFCGSAGHSPSLDEQQDEEEDQRASGDSMVAAAGGGCTPSEDGYNWRKYGQKQVKGSEYPRSYYKCTHPNCPVKKKVERSYEGHITEIIYRGVHNHSKPLPNRRSPVGLSNPLMDMQLDSHEKTRAQSSADNDLVLASTQKGTGAGTPDWRHDNVDVTSSVSAGHEFGTYSVQAQNGTHFESADAVDASSTFSNDEDDQATHGNEGYDGEGDEYESKRRKIEIEMCGATRAIREPRVVVQTTSEVDILDDGYRWRKYGQKVVKGNPNPRSYYKCTNAGCTVRKHVERASHDLKSVITTYEGKHNHDVPAARNSSHVNSGASTPFPAQAVQSGVLRPESSQLPTSATFGSFRSQLGPAPAITFSMNQPGVANLGMAGLGRGQAEMPLHSYLLHPSPANEMGFVLPKGEPNMEPLSESSLSNNPSLYQQCMSRLQLGPRM